MFLLYNTVVFIYNDDNARFCCGCCLGGNLTNLGADPQWKPHGHKCGGVVWWKPQGPSKAKGKGKAKGKAKGNAKTKVSVAKAKPKAMPRQKSLWQRQRERHWPYAKTKAKEKATGKRQNM